MICKKCNSDMIYSFREEYPHNGMYKKYYYCPACNCAEIVESIRREADQSETTRAENACADMIV